MVNYNLNIPDAPNNPSTDQPKMKTNTNAVDTILAVDHVFFNTTNGGFHNHVTFGTSQSDPGLANSQTQIYPKSFGSGASYLETYTAAKTSTGNQINGYLPFVKCMGKFTSVVGPYPQTLSVPADTLKINIATIVQTSVTSVTVTFTTALPYTTYYIFTENYFINNLDVITKNTGSIVFNLRSFLSQGSLSFMVI